MLPGESMVTISPCHSWNHRPPARHSSTERFSDGAICSIVAAGETYTATSPLCSRKSTTLAGGAGLTAAGAAAPALGTASLADAFAVVSGLHQNALGEGLKRAATAATVRVRDGERMLTDGPFAETREQLGGYMIVDVEDLDEAISIAARIPLARTSTVEIRPVREGGPAGVQKP